MGDLAMKTGIKDLATNVDHYLYSHPKVKHGRGNRLSSRERDEWQQFGAQQFARGYGPNEPEYTLADVKPEPQP